MKASLRLLMNSVIDYAGLFPPAGLSMIEAIRNYAEYCTGEASWMLGRFILPVCRIDEFEACMETLLIPEEVRVGWCLSVLGTENAEDDLLRIRSFNSQHAGNPDSRGVVIDAIELKTSDVNAIRNAGKILAGSLDTYFEIPIAFSEDFVAAIAANRGKAKVRTGGLAPEAFPTPAQLAGFILRCVAANISFKATAGLHHAIRSMHPLTFDASSPFCEMHGFVNLLLASAFAYAGADAGQVEAILLENNAEAFDLEENAFSWRKQWLGGDVLKEMRKRVCISFGSCSFEDPIRDLKDLKWL